MSSVIYGLKFSVRRPRLWIGIILGIMLGLALISGAFMTADYLGFATLRKEIEDVKVDIKATLNYPGETVIENYNTYQSRIENIDGVNLSEPILTLWCYWGNISANGISTWNMSPVEGFRIYGVAENPKLSGLSILEGTMSFAENEIAIGKDLAEYLNISIGDNVTLELVGESPGGLRKINITLKIKAIIRFSGDFLEAITYQGAGFFFSVGPEFEEAEDPNLALIGLIDTVYDLYNEMLSMHVVSLSVNMHYLIFVNRDEIIDPWNLDATIRKLEEIRTNVYFILQGLGENVNVYCFLADKLRQYNMMVTFLKMGLSFQLLPALFLGFLLALIAIWVSVNERRREIGLLKVKGAKTLQITLMLITEAVSAGFIGGCLGSGLGYVTAIISINYVAPLLASIYPPMEFLTRFVGGYIIGGLIVGAILGLLSVIMPARKAAKIDLVKALMEYVEELEAKDKISKLTIILFIMGLYSLFEVGLGFPIMVTLIRSMMTGGYVFVFVFLLIILMPIYIVLIYLGPVFFAYAASKLLAHFAGKLSKIFEKIVKPISGNLSFAAVRNFMRKRVRVSRVIFLIALTLTFSVYYAISAATNETRMQIDTQMEVGADIKIDFGYTGITYEEAMKVVDNTSEIEGIENVCRIARTTLRAAVSGDANGADMFTYAYAIDPNYFNVSFFKNEYLEDISVYEAKEALQSYGNVIVSVNMKRYYGYYKGRPIIFNVGSEERAINLTISGFVKFAPGLMYYTFQLQNRYDLTVFTGLDTAIKWIYNNDTSQISIISILVDVKDSYNASAIADSLREMLDELGIFAEVQVYEQVLAERKQFGFQYASFFFVKVEFVFALIIALAGMSLIMIMAVYERKREIALLIAKGASRKSILGMIAGEAFLITLVAFGLGILAALVYSYGFLVATLNMFMFQQEIYEFPPGYAMSIPLYLPVTLIIAFIAFILSALIPAWIITRKPLAEELRIHH